MKLLLSVWILCLSTLLSSAADKLPPPVLSGYTGKVSYAPGEEITLHVSTNLPAFVAEITRHGLQPEKVWEQPDVAGKEYAVPEDSSSMGCRWPRDRSRRTARRRSD